MHSCAKKIGTWGPTREGCRYRDIPQNTAAPGNTAVLYHSKYRGAAVFQYLVACVSVFDLSITGM